MDSSPKAPAAKLDKVEEIFHAALGREPSELAAFLDAACAGDQALRREVERLLRSHRALGSFIASPVADVAAGVFEDELPDRLIGQTIGHYLVEKRLGSGGMGVVYLARRADRQYEKQVAIKLIKRGMDSEAVLRRFRNERQILASFEHPNIARLIDGDTTDDGLPYFVMEYVEGLPIHEYCDRAGLTTRQRLELFCEVCGAVSYAHRRAVIHRDIKPSNILVGADGVPKLLDFGIARMLQPGEGAEPAATMFGTQVMTPEYASPEQVLGAPATTASDVYSLGVVLYRLLTGCLPHRVEGRPAGELAREIAGTSPQRPSTVVEVRTNRLRRELRGDLDNIVLMALRKEPERRYPSVEQLADDIERHLATRPVLARPDTLAYRSAKFVRRNVAASVAAALVVLSLLGGITATTWQAQKARQQEAIARAAKARAEHRFDEVRRLAHSVLFDYHDAIKDLPGATAVRERLARDSLAYLDSLAGEAGDDPALQRELADAYERLGDVRGAPLSASLGDVAGARDSYLKALQIREALVAADPQDVQLRRDVARSYIRLGSLMAETDEAARGTQHLRDGVALLSELAAERPGDATLRQELPDAHTELGFALEEWGDIAGALENQRQALALREALAESAPDDPTHRRNLADAYVNVGRALLLGGETGQALASNQKGLAIHMALVSEYPDNAAFRRRLAIGYQNDGDYRAVLGDAAGALGSFRRKLVLDEQAVARDPANAQARSDLGYSLTRIGELHAEAGRYAEARSYTRRAVEAYESVSREQPAQLGTRYRTLIVRGGLAEWEAQLGERDAALKECSRLLAELDGIALDPANALQSDYRAEVYISVARVHETLARSAVATADQQAEHRRAARDMYGRSLAIWKDLERRGILTDIDADQPRQVERALEKLGAPAPETLPDPAGA